MTGRAPREPGRDNMRGTQRHMRNDTDKEREREEAGYRPPYAGYRERGGQGRIACGEGGHLPAARERLRFSGRLPAAAAQQQSRATSTDVTRMCDSEMTRMTPDTGGHPSPKAARPGAPSVRRRETVVSYIS